MPSGKGALRIAIEDFLDTYLFGGVVGDWIRSGIEEQESETGLVVSGSIKQVMSALKEYPVAYELLKKPLAGEDQGGLMTMGGFGAQMGMSAASGLMSPVMRMINYTMDKRLTSARADPTLAFAMARRKQSFRPQLMTGLGELGWHDDYIELWDEITLPRIADNDLITLRLRGVVPPLEMARELKRRGWSMDEQRKLLQVRQIVPQVQDLITMAVREAFTPDIVDKYNLQAEFPPQFAAEAAKHGLSEEWARHYWSSHWQLPSIQLGYEMFHRLRGQDGKTAFTEADLKLLLRTQDVAPYWRQFLVDISYRPLTRVDVRRMFKAGAIDDKKVDSSYRDLGYNDENARLMTDWTIKESRATEKELTRSAVIKGYKKKTLNAGETADALSSIGYDEYEVAFWMGLADLDIEEQLLDEELDRVSFLFIEGEISQSQVYDELGQFNLPAEQLEDLLTRWNIKIRKKISLPTRSDLESFYKRDIIAFEDFEDGMKRRRYSEETIVWYSQQLDQEVAEAAILEMERARREQERLLTAEASTQYARDKAGLDTEIAQAKVAIAEIKLSLHSIEDPDQIKILKERIDNIKLFITQVQLSKAFLKQDFEDIEITGE